MSAPTSKPRNSGILPSSPRRRCRHSATLAGVGSFSLKSTTWVSGRGAGVHGPRAPAQVQVHDVFPVVNLAGLYETQPSIEWLGRALTGHIAHQQGRCIGPPTNVFDHLLQRAAAKAQALIAMVHHEPPEIVFGLVGVVREHDKAYGRLVGIDGPRPGVTVVGGFRQGGRIGGHKLFLLLGRPQTQHWVEVGRRDGAQADQCVGGWREGALGS